MLHAPLTVRINDGTSDRHVTRYASGLKFTKTAPGGHQACSFDLNLPRNVFPDLGPADRCWIYDAGTGRIVFDAYLENPTPTDGIGGESYSISAMGGMVRASDEARALSYVDQTLDGWAKALDSAKSSSVETGDLQDSSGTPMGNGILASFPSGTLAASGAFASAANYALQRAGMELGAIHAVVDGGKTDSDWATDFVNTGGIITTGTLSTGPTAFDIYVGGGSGADVVPAGTDRFAFRLRRTGLDTNVADDDTVLLMAGVYVLARRMDRHGTPLTGAAGMGTLLGVTASQVAEDLLGRLLTFCDPGTAQVDASSFTIDQLAYPDGIKAADVLNDLATFEPDLLWEILETLPNGLHRYNYRAWPTSPRYVVSVKDGWVQSGSDIDLCNRITVNWTDAAGQSQFKVVTAASLGLTGLGYPVDQLEAEGRVKDADPVTLPDGRGSEANAVQVAAGVLRDKVNPPTAGSVTVRRKILDLLTGNLVAPWELEPGYVCRVREMGHDLRVTQVDYDDDSVSSVLTLGTPVLSTEQRLARLARAA